MAPPFIKRYLLALERHKWVGLAGCITVAGISAGAAMLQPPPAKLYITQGLMTYGAPPDLFSATGSSLRQRGEAVSEELLLSNYVVKQAADKLAANKIDVEPEQIRRKIKVAITGGSGGQPAADAKDAKEAAPTSDVLRIVVSYKDADEERSKAIAYAMMEAMIAQSKELNSQQLKSIQDNLNQLLPKVTRELRDAENKLEQYVRVEGSAIQAAQSGSLVQAITTSQQQQRDNRLALAGVQAQIASLQSRLGLTPDEAYNSSALSADPIIGELRGKIYQAEEQLKVLSNSLREEHPTMIDLNNQLKTYNQLLQDRVAEVIGGRITSNRSIRQASSLDPTRQQLASSLVSLSTQWETLQNQLGNLTRTEQELRQEYSSIPNKQLEQQRLEQQVALRRAFYDQIQARLADVTLAQQETVGSLVLAQDPQTEVQVEAGPSRLIILLVGGFIGILVGGGLVFLLDAIDSKFYTLEDLQGALRQEDVPILGLLPALPWNERDERLLSVILESDSPYLEAYERLRSNLRRATGGKAPKVVMLTSVINGEGKSLSAYNLAIASARAGKRTLLVEADLRSPSDVEALYMKVDAEHQAEPLRYYGNFSECIRLVPEIENLYIVPSVGPQRQAAAVLESSEMRRLLDDARGRFDLVVVDAPALNRCNDAMLLEPLTDGLILVTRPGVTESGLLNEVVQRFMESEMESSQVKFLGAIINDTDIPILLPYGYRDESDEEVENESKTEIGV
jgi:capsular exopolysaccharide synthesis family protein